MLPKIGPTKQPTPIAANRRPSVVAASPSDCIAGSSAKLTIRTSADVHTIDPVAFSKHTAATFLMHKLGSAGSACHQC